MKKKLQDGTVYFRQKDILRPLGAVLLPLGLVVLYFGWGFISYILGAICVPVGLVLFIVGGARYVSDNDVAELMDHALLDYDRSVTEMTGYERVVLKQPAPFEISAYDFGEQAKYFKKGKNGTPVSDRFTRTHIFYTKDTLMIVGRSLILTELDGTTDAGITEFAEHIAISGITSATLEQYETPVILTNTGKTMTVKWCELVLMGNEGELLRVPAKNDMDAINFVDDINRKNGR
jgi:hypothetical protein